MLLFYQLQVAVITLSVCQRNAKAHVLHVLCRSMQGLDITCFTNLYFYSRTGFSRCATLDALVHPLQARAKVHVQVQ